MKRFVCHSTRVVLVLFGSLFQYPPIAVFRHPQRAGKVAFPTTPRPHQIGCRIAVQHDPRDFGPVRTLRIRVQQAQIGNVMLLVMGGDVVAGR